MNIKNIHLAYYSATFSTRRIVREIATAFQVPVKEYDLTPGEMNDDITLGGEGDLLLIGVPSYAGRVPERAVRPIRRFLGNNTPAIIICVYGNRAYDDTLVELEDLVEERGFKVVSAAAMIAQHCIFPKVAEGRPNKEDLAKLYEFAKKSQEILNQLENVADVCKLEVSGNRPYCAPKSVPIHPKGNKNECSACLSCVKMCPVGAIFEDAPYKTDNKKCIACGRCIVVCPQHIRHFGGLLYKIADWKFKKSYTAPKQPEFFYVNK